MTDQAKILRLREELHQHAVAYYVHNSPTLTDAEYDRSFAELKRLEALHPELADANSPTNRVGSPEISSSFAKVNHTAAMLSLDNAFTSDEVNSFFSDVPAATKFLVEWKIDGLSLSLKYKDGNLISAVTRGDGTTGDDVTANARTVCDIPLVLSEKLTIEVRGEVYMPKAIFAQLNVQRQAQGDELFANPRNAASGTMKQRDPSEVARRQLRFLAYQAYGLNHADEQKLLAKLKALNFNTPESWVTTLAGASELIQTLDTKRATMSYDVDGLVFKVNDRALQNELGIGTRSPKWAVAYKFPAEQKVTKLMAITVQVGRRGTLTPVAELKPINLAGTTVKRASLCNQDEIIRLGINIGDDVIVEKAGEIIPKVVGRAVRLSGSSQDGHWRMPATCPCCSTPVKRNEGQVAYYCPNTNCPDQVSERLQHAVSKRSLDIDGCGSAQINILISLGVTTLSGLFSIQNVSSLGASASVKFLREREKAKSAPLWRKLQSLGIEDVGTSSCKELAARFSSLEEMIEHADELRSILGPVATRSFLDGVQANLDEIECLAELGFYFKEDAQARGILSGKVFVITGAMMSGTRDTVAALVESKGGTVKPSVSKKVNFLVRGDGAGQNKTAAAEKYGVPIITEDDLYAMMGVTMTIDTTVTTEREY